MCTQKSMHTTSAMVHYVRPDYTRSCSRPVLLRKRGHFHDSEPKRRNPQRPYFKK